MTLDTIKADAGQVFVIDDDMAVNESIAAVLSCVGYTVQSFPLAADFLEQARITEPSAVLVDMLLPGMTGLNLCREIVRLKMPCSFAIISGQADVASAVEAMRLGAIDLLEKPFSSERLLATVHEALQSARSNHRRRFAEEEVTRRVQELSPREQQVFEAMAGGYVTKEIAKLLNISARTVDVHRSRIMQKMAIESPLQLARILAVLERKAARARSASA